MQMMKTIRMAVEEGLQFPEAPFPVLKSLMYLDRMTLACAPEPVLFGDIAE